MNAPSTGAEPAQIAFPHPGALPAATELAHIVEFKNVSKTYSPGTPRAYTAVKDINFVVHDLPKVGELIAMLGRPAAARARSCASSPGSNRSSRPAPGRSWYRASR